MFNKFNDIFEKNNLAFKKYKVKFSDNNTNDTKVSKHNIKFQFFIIENDKNNNIKIDEIINKYSQKISSDLRNFSLYELNNLERKLDENYFWKKNIFDNEIKEKKYSNAIDRIENKFLMQEFDNKIDFAINLKYIELQKKFLIESDYNFFFNKSIKKNKDTIIIKSIILFISIILLSFILRKFISLKKKLFEII